jgi:hypothetical protein
MPLLRRPGDGKMRAFIGSRGLGVANTVRSGSGLSRPYFRDHALSVTMQFPCGVSPRNLFSMALVAEGNGDVGRKHVFAALLPAREDDVGGLGLTNFGTCMCAYIIRFCLVV